jgi:NTE family protein
MILSVALAGCAAPQIYYRDVMPPEARPLVPVAMDHPVVALVLGGGASRGFAHVGVINALERAGIPLDIIVGTSAGSFVGALYAGGYSGKGLEYIALNLSEEQLRDVVYPDRGFVRGELLQDFINRHLGNRSIENLNKRFVAVATDLTSGALTAFDHGNTGMAVRASSAIPGIFQPVAINGRDYVDGGLVSPVPVRVARTMGADIVIAVDVSRKPENAVTLQSTADILGQTIAIMGKTVSACEIDEADVIIRPDTSEIGTVDFEHKTEAMEKGAEAARNALPKIREWLEKKRQEFKTRKTPAAAQ